jgi:hypothetical protein
MIARRALLLGAVLAALLACKRSGSGSGTELIEATDHRSRMTVPSDWSRQSDLNDKADLQVGNRATPEFVIVLTEAKEDFAEMDPAKLLEHHMSGLEKTLAGASRVPLPTSQVGPYPARASELHGTAENLNLVYLITAVEGPRYFHGIIAWTTKSRYAEAKPRFERAVQTFQEI